MWAGNRKQFQQHGRERARGERGKTSLWFLPPCSLPLPTFLHPPNLRLGAAIAADADASAVRVLRMDARVPREAGEYLGSGKGRKRRPPLPKRAGGRAGICGRGFAPLESVCSQSISPSWTLRASFAILGPCAISSEIRTLPTSRDAQ